MSDTPPSSDFEDPNQPSHAASLTTRPSVGYRQLPLTGLMDIHEGTSWESMSKNLEIGQRDESQLERRADSFTAIGCVELSEQVVEMRFDRRDSEA